MSMKTWKWPVFPEVSPSGATILIPLTTRAMVAVSPETTVAVGADESCRVGDAVVLAEAEAVGDAEEPEVCVDLLQAVLVKMTVTHSAPRMIARFKSPPFVRLGGNSRLWEGSVSS